jgi:hypothetical protein
MRQGDDEVASVSQLYALAPVYRLRPRSVCGSPRRRLRPPVDGAATVIDLARVRGRSNNGFDFNPPEGNAA